MKDHVRDDRRSNPPFRTASPSGFRTLTLLFATVVATACDPASGTPEKAHLASVDANRLVLSVSPNEVAEGRAVARRLEAVTELSSLDIIELGSLADIAFHGQEGFVIGDGIGHQVLLLDRPGATPRRLTGPGSGPGEIGMLNALTTAGEHVIVWDASPARALQMYHPRDGHLTSVQAPVPGDWTAILFRQVQTHWDSRQSGPEHTSDRLIRADGGHFIHILQDDERQVPRPPNGTLIEGLWTTAIRYDLSGQIVDTVGRLPAPPTRYDRDHGPTPMQDLHAPRARFSASPHHVAFAHGDSSHIVVMMRGAGGDSTLRVDWEARKRPLGDEDADVVIDMIREIGFIEDVEWRAHWDAMSRAQRRAETRAVRRQFIRLPPLAPEVTGLWSDGACLFVTGHMTDQSFDGTSRFMLGIDLDRREVHVLELPYAHPRFRVRDLARGEILVTTRTEDGAWGIHVFQHGLGCSGTQGAD